ncbi:putative 116 kDa u5 small nuclear ribonucleoprotein component [Atractiella rhizophila]|nr:putative 116 kDa u5 small nuclear ribonucleoprotein component [Atractiella rhizophila]
MDDYDEFGNFIGQLSDSEGSSREGSEELEEAQTQKDARRRFEEGLMEVEEDEPMDGRGGGGMSLMQVDEPGPSNQVVLHDDKKYYSTLEETYGPDVETLVQEEDAQPLSEPIIAPVNKGVKFSVVDKRKEGPETRFDKDFMLFLATHQASIRNVAVVGHLHHGKTSLIDMLVYETHKIDWDTERPLRYTQTHTLSQARGISLKSSPMSLVLQNSKQKSYLFNILDTPGHVNFEDETAAAVRLADGAIVVVDVAEGVLLETQRVIKHLMTQSVPMVLVLNKMDRLILELRLPPSDAYFKIRHTIEEVNTVISSINPDPKYRLSPEKGNVAFASSSMGWCFTLRSFAKMYADTFGSMDIEQFALRLWGDIFYDPEAEGDRKKFSKQGGGTKKRSFDHFILEPLYKLYTQVLASDKDKLKETLGWMKIYLKPVMYKMDVRPLLKVVLGQFFGPSTGLVDLVVDNIPNPLEGASAKLETTFTGPLDSPMAQAIRACDPAGPLIVHAAKLYPTHDAQEFRTFGRILSGTVKPGQEVKVLGEGYSQEDEEDMLMQKVNGVWICESRYNVETNGLSAGNYVLLGGVDNSINKTATIVDPNIPPSDLYIFKPLKHMTQSVVKISIEPMNPSELPKMLDGLRKINKTYPLVETKVEESGEHVLMGTGELYLDSVMHDLRRMFAEIEIKVSDPVVRFCETVIDTSALKVYAETPNKKNKITMISEPLEKGIAEDIETGRVSIKMAPKDLGNHFQKKYGWDLLASRSIWAFGPDDLGPNILVNDTLPSEVDKKLLFSIKESVKQGFQWASREGPLCDEPMRNVKFRLLDATIAPEPIFRGGGQIIPTARRVCYSSFLLSTPRLTEPVYFCEIVCPAESVSDVYTVLARRRGHVTKDIPKPGSPLYTVQAYIPVLDSAGFETDLRTHTLGQAMVLQTFDHWSIVPGDPLDKTIQLRPLEPSSANALSRDVLLKIRRRKGLGDVVSVSKYLEQDMLIAMAANPELSDLLG